MVPVFSLWLPVVLAAVFVFAVSSVIHMVLRYHANDYRALPDESGVMDALSRFTIAPGDYALPKAGSMAALKDPVFLARLAKGPVFMGTFMRPGPMNMGPSLVQWFVYCAVVGVFAAYVTGSALAPGADYLSVFRLSGTVAFAGYALAQWQDSIWLQKSVATTLRNNFDGLVYALVTAGTFGWLWPR